jgi:hypothetical protein
MSNTPTKLAAQTATPQIVTVGIAAVAPWVVEQIALVCLGSLAG